MGTGYNNAAHKSQAISALGALLGTIGDMQAGMTLQEEGFANARKVLGEAHLVTQRAAECLACDRERAAAQRARGLPSGLRALGVLSGLSSNARIVWDGVDVGVAELNGKFAWVVGFSQGHYQVRLDEGGGAPSDTPLHVKPSNVMPVPRLQLRVVIPY